MARLPFIQEEAQARSAQMRAGGTGSEAIGQAMQQIGNVAQNVMDDINRKRNNDRLMEERELNARFAAEESLLIDEQINKAKTSDEINSLGEGYQQAAQERYDKFVKSNLGLEAGSERYERMRQDFAIRSGITLMKTLEGGVAKKNATFFLDRGDEARRARLKALQKNPELLDATFQEGSVYDGLDLPSGVSASAMQKVRQEEFSEYALTSGLSQVNSAVSVGELKDLREAVFDEGGLYFKNLSPEGLKRLDEAINTRSKGLQSKVKTYGKQYMAQIAHNYADRDPALEAELIEAGEGDALKFAIDAHETVRELASMTPQERAEVIASYQPGGGALDVPPEQFESASRFGSVVVNQAAQLNKEFADSPYNYSLKYNQDILQMQTDVAELLQNDDPESRRLAFDMNQDLISQIDAYQEDMGVPVYARQIISPSHPIHNIMKMAAMSGDDKQVVRAVEMFSGLYGPAYQSRAIAQIGDKMPDAVLAVMMASSEGGKLLAASHVNAKDQELDDLLKGKSIDFRDESPSKAFNAALIAGEYTQRILASHNNEVGGVKLAARHVRILTRQAKLAMLRNEAATPEDALKQAYEDMFESNVVYVSAKNDTVRVPQSASYALPNVEFAIRRLKTDGKLPGLNVRPLPAERELAGLSYEQRKERTNALLKTNLALQTAKDNSGMLVYFDNGRQLTPLFNEDTDEQLFLTWDELDQYGWGLRDKFSRQTSEALEAAATMQIGP